MRQVKREQAYKFERETRVHATRDTKGLLNRLRPPHWLAHNDRKVQLKTAEILEPFVREVARPVVLVVGVGSGGIFDWIWEGTEAVRLGVDVNHAVMVDAMTLKGRDHFRPIEADAALLPLRACSVDVVVFDFVLHHLTGQGVMEDAIREAARVLRPGGIVVAREPSSYSFSGLLLNLVNRFRLMNALSGASNYEFALAPPQLIRLFERFGAVEVVHGLTYFWSHRMPPWMQDFVTRWEPIAVRGHRRQWVADFLLYVVRKDGNSGRF
jgi:SAM-dependent methyltransferase